MPRPSNPSFDTVKNISTYLRIVLTQAGLLLQTLDYYAVKRMVEIDSDDVSVDEECEDGLAELFVDGLEALATTTGNTEVAPMGSISALFDSGPLQKSLKPKCYMAMDLRDNAKIVACLVSCKYLKDETLGTQLFTTAFLQRHKVPRLTEQWLFVDVVSSKKAPAGSALLVSSILGAARQKMVGVCLVAVSAHMRDLCKALGFSTVQYNDQGQRFLCYLHLSDLKFEPIMKKLRFPGDKVIVEDICWRFGLSAKTRERVIGRC